MQLAHDMGRQYGSQAEYDAAQPAEDRRAELVEIECTHFADEFCTNEMDAQTFYQHAKEFAGETLADYIAEDDQQKLLQLVLKYRNDPLAKSVMNRLYTAAYKHKEKELEKANA